MSWLFQYVSRCNDDLILCNLKCLTIEPTEKFDIFELTLKGITYKVYNTIEVKWYLLNYLNTLG